MIKLENTTLSTLEVVTGPNRPSPSIPRQRFQERHRHSLRLFTKAFLPLRHPCPKGHLPNDQALDELDFSVQFDHLPDEEREGAIGRH